MKGVVYTMMRLFRKFNVHHAILMKTKEPNIDCQLFAWSGSLSKVVSAWSAKASCLGGKWRYQQQAWWQQSQNCRETPFAMTTTQANTEANTNFVCGELMIWQLQCKQVQDLVQTLLQRRRRCVFCVCPVCHDTLKMLLPTADENEPWMDEIRVVHKHCDNHHASKYLWNACHKEEKTRLFQCALPHCLCLRIQNFQLLVLWKEAHVCTSMYGILNLKKGQTIAQLIVQKNKQMRDKVTMMPKQLHSNQRQCITSRKSSWKLGVQRPQMLFSVPIYCPRNWKAYSHLRKSNLILLFFWDGDIVICNSFQTFLLPCTSRMLSSGIDDKN